MDAYGYIEVLGLVPAVAAADAALKAANVEVVGKEGIISSGDPRIRNDGFSFALSPDDVDVKVTFLCELIV